MKFTNPRRQNAGLQEQLSVNKLLGINIPTVRGKLMYKELF